jgi:hypothetical protein
VFKSASKSNELISFSTCFSLLLSFSPSFALSLSLSLPLSPSLAPFSHPHARMLLLPLTLSCYFALSLSIPFSFFLFLSRPFSPFLVLSRRTEHTPQWAPTARGPFCCSSYEGRNSTTGRPAVAVYRQVRTADTRGTPIHSGSPRRPRRPPTGSAAHQGMPTIGNVSLAKPSH